MDHPAVSEIIDSCRNRNIRNTATEFHVYES